MPISRITSKGQATIPKSIRRVLNVRPCDRISFHVEKGKVWLEGLRQETTPLFGKYQYKVKRPVSVKEMDEAVKKKAGQ